MESQAMQLPLYVKVIALIGAVMVVFVLAAWELVKDWIATAMKTVVGEVKPKFARKKIRKPV